MTEPSSKRAAANEYIAAKVRSALAHRKIGRGQAAEALGIHRTVLSRRVNGHVPFEAADLMLLAGLMQISPATLLTETEWPNGEVMPSP